MVDIKQSLKEILTRIEAMRAASSLAAPEVTLIGVSKFQPETKIDAALAAGLRHFGENRVQEAKERWTPRRGTPGLTLHLIGPLQTNKAAEAVALFDVIHTVDRPKLADILAQEMKKQGHQLPCFVQVNTGEEPQKAGIAPSEAEAFVAYCKNIGLMVTGLMCIPPADDNPAPHFALLRELAQGLGLPHLSMGMSGDFETAIRFGTTHVRVGTALFGDRMS